jgi:hypothetical protein
MNLQVDFDTLRDYALNCAVATELGWTQDAKHKRWWTDTEGRSHTILFDDDRQAAPLSRFDPAHDPTDSWTLDGDGWHWSYYECYNQHNTTNPTWLDMEMCAIGKDAEADVTLLLADFKSKAEAHATARCIVWLKARSVKRTTLVDELQSNVGENTPAQYGGEQ